MSRHVEFHFDIVCPYAYLGSTQIEALAARCDATVSWHPFLLGGVFKSIRVDPTFTLKMPAAKTRHNLLDAIRWADFLGVDFAWHPNHPMRTVSTMRALLALADDKDVIADPAPIKALYRAYWVDHRDLTDDTELAAVLSECGLDGAALLEQTRSPALKQRLKDVSARAAQRGVFGAPAMFVDGALYWGQDRLEFVEAALKGEMPT